MWNIALGEITLKDLWYAGVLSAILVAVIMLIVAIYQLLVEPSRKRQKVSRRMTEGLPNHQGRVDILREGSADTVGWWPRLLKKLLGPKRLNKLRVRLLQADIRYTPGLFLMWSSYLSILGLLAGFWVLRNPIIGILGGGLGILPFFYMGRKSRTKTQKFEKQMPDAMELLSRSLRAGHTLPGAIELLSREMPDPMGKEMAIVHGEQQYGIGTAEALVNMLDRVSSMDLRYFVGAVWIQQNTGGNLAELMENLANVIRSRLNFKSKVSSLTAMGRISTTIMIVTPIVAFFALMLIAREYERALIETTIGRTMLTIELVLILLGAFLLRRMIRAVET